MMTKANHLGALTAAAGVLVAVGMLVLMSVVEASAYPRAKNKSKR